jgi:cytochrome P450
MGPKLPAGTIIACDVHHINNSKDLWRNPATFDGMRFHELRKQPGMENKWQYTSVAKETPGWGDGNMACPGRFFANSTIKIALAHLILNYDFKFVEGQSVPAKLALPNGSWNPGLETRFMFKARK